MYLAPEYFRNVLSIGARTVQDIEIPSMDICKESVYMGFLTTPKLAYPPTWPDLTLFWGVENMKQIDKIGFYTIKW